MTSSDKEARARERDRDAQVGLPARRAAAELLSAVLQKKQALDDILGRSLEKGAMFNLTARDRALTRAIVATSLRRKGQLDHVLGAFLERGLPERSGTLYPILLSAAAQLVFLKTPPHAVDRPCRHARPIRSQGEALRQAGQCRAAQGRERRRGDRGESRCGAGQHAGLAVVAVGRLLGRDART